MACYVACAVLCHGAGVFTLLFTVIGVLCVHTSSSTRRAAPPPGAADAGAQRALGCVLNSENKLAAYATRARQPRSLGVGGHQHWVCTSLGRSALLAVCCEERGAQGAALPVPLAPGGGASLTPACAQAPLCIECPPLGTRTRPSTILRHRAPVDDIHRSSCNLCLRLPILRSFVRSPDFTCEPCRLRAAHASCV